MLSSDWLMKGVFFFFTNFSFFPLFHHCHLSLKTFNCTQLTYYKQNKVYLREKTFYDIQILLFFSIVSENFFFHDLVSCVQLKVFNDKWQWWKSGKNEKLVKKKIPLSSTNVTN
jgi:hypothetical protein